MDNAEMNSSHLRGLIVQQGDDAFNVGRRQLYLLVHLASRGLTVHLVVRRKEAPVGGLNVPSHSDRTHVLQPRLGGAFPPHILKHGIPVSKDHVGNQLFVSDVLFGFVPFHELIIRRIQQDGEIPLHVEVVPLEPTDPVQQGSRED